MINMATLHISLSEQLKAFVQTNTLRRGFSNYSDYIRHLIRDERKKEQERKNQLLNMNISDDLLLFIQEISLISSNDEKKKKIINTYVLSENKKKNPISSEEFMKKTDRISDIATNKGMTPEILENILNGK
jgi:Arc/MetJ-type ribon-helix-helix transcriptional regulator